MAIQGYYYNTQLKKALIVFASIFSGMQVRTGKNACGDEEMLDVPIHYGSGDRVAQAIASGNTQNRLPTLPTMTCYMTGIEPAPDRKHGSHTMGRKTFLEQGGVYPNDVKGLTWAMPTPYNLGFELSIFTSNTDQAWQILEQIMLIFDDYDLQVQFNDTPFDYAKITKVTLDSIGNEENFPVGTDRRLISWTLNFTFYTWISPPAEIRENLINNINIKLGSLDEFRMNEVGEDGTLSDFNGNENFGDITILSPAEVQGINDVELGLNVDDREF
jgi:hypothetical protein